jgi:peptidoglycan/xylan/chitin deacetylase (PgdA/CDA1 family)
MPDTCLMESGCQHSVLRGAYLLMAASRALYDMSVGRGRESRWVTLCYHAVLPQDKRCFARQMQLIAARAAGTPSIGSLGCTGPQVCVTFDDCYACLLDSAVPVLTELRIPATFFAVTDNLGCSPRWPIAGDDPCAQAPLMTERDLRSLPADLFTVGSHTASHPRLDRLSLRSMKAELTRSRARLEDVLGKPVRALSFPHGAYSGEVVRAARLAGYEQLFTIEARVTWGPGPHLLHGRFGASPRESVMEFRLKAMGCYDWLYHVRRWKAMAVRIAGIAAPFGGRGLGVASL